MQNIFRFNKVGIVIAILSSCQSSRLPGWFSPGTTYHASLVTLPPSNDSMVAKSYVSTAEVLEKPVLTATLPIENYWLREQITYQKQELGILRPDTTIKTPEIPVLSGKADPTTTVVNSIGGVMAAVGIGVVIANSGEAPKTEWGGLSQLIGFLGGLVIALLGLGLLFFQGKNGRLRRLREARKAAALPSIQTLGKPVTPETENPDLHAGQKKKKGFRLMMIGGVMGLLGLLVSGYFLLLLPVAVVMLLVGAVISIVGM